MCKKARVERGKKEKSRINDPAVDFDISNLMLSLIDFQFIIEIVTPVSS